MAEERIPWTREQNLMALWGYWRIRQNPPGLVKEHLYREIGDLIGRKSSAVAMKISNFAACNVDEPKSATLPHIQGEVLELFEEYWPTKLYELDATHEQLLAFFAQGFPSPLQVQAAGLLPAEEKTHFRPVFIEEGIVHLYHGTRRDRSAELAEEARTYYRSQSPDGLLRCTVCSISFDPMDLPNVMHIHHLHPIAQYSPEGRKMPLLEALQNVRPLCPTCHAIVHAGRQNRPLDEVQKLRQQAK